MSYDLFIQTPRDTILTSKDKKELFEKLLLETKLDELCEITDDPEDEQSICSLAMPKPTNRNTALVAYRLIIQFARRHDLVVDDPQIGENINLADPGELPPMMFG